MVYAELEAVSDNGTLKKSYHIEGKMLQVPAATNGLDSEAIRQWLNNAVGTVYDGDGMYGPQCKDFADAYALWLDHPLKPSNAADIWDVEQDSFWVKIPYEAGEQPQPGDLAVWAPWENNPYGHVSVVFESHNGYFISVDQNVNNQDGNKGAKKVKHSYNKPIVLGYLRPSP